MWNMRPRAMFALCTVLLGAALYLPSLCWAADDESWAGKRVILKRDGVRIGHSDGGRIVYVAVLTDINYTVRQERDGWLCVRQRGAEGWFPKNDAVLLGDAVGYFTERIGFNRGDALAYAHRARANQERGDLDRALDDYNEALRMFPVQPAWFRNRGTVYHDKKDYDQAVRDYDEAVRLNPQDPLTYLDRGLAYKGKKAFDQAVADYTEAARLDPDWADAYYNRANVYKARKEYDRALADYGTAIRLDPSDPDAWFNRASVFAAQKDYAKAAADFGEVTRLDPKDSEAHDRLAWLLATCPDAKVRDGKQAVDHAATACELTDGDSPYLLATLAAAYAEAGKFDLAVKWQRRALDSPKYDSEERENCRRRLKLFEERKAYREE